MNEKKLQKENIFCSVIARVVKKKKILHLDTYAKTFC